MTKDELDRAFSEHFQRASFFSHLGFDELAHEEKWKSIDAWNKLHALRANLAPAITNR